MSTQRIEELKWAIGLAMTSATSKKFEQGQAGLCELMRVVQAGALQWVPTAKRLPEHDGPVMIFAYTDDKRTPAWRACKIATLSDDGFVWIGEDSENDWCDFEEVTHWMELPTPPNA